MACSRPRVVNIFSRYRVLCLSLGSEETKDSQANHSLKRDRGSRSHSLLPPSCSHLCRTRCHHAQVFQAWQRGVFAEWPHYVKTGITPTWSVTNMVRCWPLGSMLSMKDKPYGKQPCYLATFGPKGFGWGGADSLTSKKTEFVETLLPAHARSYPWTSGVPRSPSRPKSWIFQRKFKKNY